MRLKDNKKGCRVKKNYSLMLYQRVMGDFYPINSEGKFTLSEERERLVHPENKCYYNRVLYFGSLKRQNIYKKQTE